MPENTVPDDGIADQMTYQQRHDELVAHARRLVGRNLVSAHLVSINVAAGTVRNARTGQLLHYESGILARAFHLGPQKWAEA